jgi:hypothetical protein
MPRVSAVAATTAATSLAIVVSLSLEIGMEERDRMTPTIRDKQFVVVVVVVVENGMNKKESLSLILRLPPIKKGGASGGALDDQGALFRTHGTIPQ